MCHVLTIVVVSMASVHKYRDKPHDYVSTIQNLAIIICIHRILL